jgi:hypothetical protein
VPPPDSGGPDLSDHLPRMHSTRVRRGRFCKQWRLAERVESVYCLSSPLVSHLDVDSGCLEVRVPK